MEPVRLESKIDLSTTSEQSRSEFHARLVRAGRITRADGEPGPFTIPPETLSSATINNLFEGLAVFADHPSFFENAQVKHLVGVTYDSYWNVDAESVNATIRFYDDEEAGADIGLARTIAGALRMMLDDVDEGIPAPDVGISIVFWPVWEESDSFPKVLKAFKKIDSADIVFSPAADGRILEALSSYMEKDLENAPQKKDSNKTNAFSRKVGASTPVEELSDVFSPKVGVSFTSEAPTDALEKEVPMTEQIESNSTEELQAQAVEIDVSVDEVYGRPPVDEVNEWAAAAQAAAVPAILAGSGLPEASKMRLARTEWLSPGDLSQAVEAERDYLAELTQDSVIQMPGSHPRGAGQVAMRTSLDRIQTAAEALFAGERPPSDVQPLTGIRELYLLLSGDYELTGVFNPERIMFANVNSSTMAGLVANALNKRVVNLFQQYPQWWLPIVFEEDFANLQDVRWITLGGVGELPTVAEGAAYTELTWDDQTDTDAFVKKGGYLGLTLEAIDKETTPEPPDASE